jgi:uncharacterized phage protein gp47/JayE
VPLERPSIAELIARIESDIETRLPGADARLRRALLHVLARMHAGAVHGLYGHLDWLARQLMADTAEAEHLARWAGIWGVARTAATRASGPVTFTGTDASVVPAGTVLQTSDGATYTTDADATLTAGSATATVSADAAGAAGNLEPSVPLSLVSPVAGVQSQAHVAAGGLSGGLDAESDAGLRERLLDRIRRPPQGGAAADYTRWAREVAGVTRAWVYPGELGLGTVSLRFMMDAAYPDGIPLAADVGAVQDYIEARRPVTAQVSVLAPIAVPLAFTLSVTPDTAAVRAAVQAELQDLLRRDAEPGATILISRIREAISIAAGESDHVLSAPVADVTHQGGEIAVMGAITWA